MKNGILLLVFPCLMLLFTLAISYIERLYRARLRRRANLEQLVTNAPLHYYYLPAGEANRRAVPNAKRPSDPLT